jgi:hypothetical protein
MLPRSSITHQQARDACRRSGGRLGQLWLSTFQAAATESENPDHVQVPTISIFFHPSLASITSSLTSHDLGLFIPLHLCVLDNTESASQRRLIHDYPRVLFTTLHNFPCFVPGLSPSVLSEYAATQAPHTSDLLCLCKCCNSAVQCSKRADMHVLPSLRCETISQQRPRISFDLRVSCLASTFNMREAVCCLLLTTKQSIDHLVCTASLASSPLSPLHQTCRREPMSCKQQQTGKLLSHINFRCSYIMFPSRS